MNHFGKGLRGDKFQCALKGITVMPMPLSNLSSPVLILRKPRILGPGQWLTSSTFNGMARCDALLRGWLQLRLRRALMTCVTLHHGLAIVLEISWHLAEQPQHAPGSLLGWLFVRIPVSGYVAILAGNT